MVRFCVSYPAMTHLFRRVYSRLGPGVGSFNVSIDGSPPQNLSGTNPVDLYQRILWSNTSLGPGRHTVTLTNVDDIVFGLDFFRSVINEARR